MPDLNFTFGIGNYINFTFNLQLGIPPNLRKSASQEQSTSIAGEDSATSTPLPARLPQIEKPTICNEQPIDPAKPALIASNCQPLTVQGPSQHINGFDDCPVFGAPTALSADGPALDFTRPLPRTPKSRRHCRMAITPRRRFKTRLFTFNSTRKRTIQLPGKFFALPTEPLPIKPFTNQLPTPPESNTSETPCSLPSSFQTLPLEIKHMIYRELLVSSAPIKKPHRLVCSKRNVMLDSLQPVKDIDSTILRVCRSIYDEALPVLYGHNTFEFAKPRKLRDFSHGPPGAPPPVPDRKRIWSHWHQYFFNDEDSLNRYDSILYPPVTNEFPALDKVELDFTEWQLGEGDAIRAEPFVSKLGRSGGLSVVVIRGIKNAMNLRQLQQGLVKPGGTFTAIP
ncbi:MAG: hypothetical protein LQ343_003999 [Gyalolechia ehrenbergii]|nr:MAG: hypothetical protein LQ343_003999 [Gyalolechia ehrenbergii]